MPVRFSMGETFLSGAVALTFALVHVFGRTMRFLRVTPRSIWLSLAGGVSLAYVFVHLLPELAEHQEETFRALSGTDGFLRSHVYLIALFGLILFYGLERLMRQKARTPNGVESPAGLFWLHLSSYTAYNALIGYLLVHREDMSPEGLVVYALALGLHFVVNDQGLREHHGQQYDRAGRWVLAAAPLLGWAGGLITNISEMLLGALFAFLAGGIVLNVLKEELPEDRESRFWALAVGAAGFSALLLAHG